nr:group II intron maturase-specific domain-containing protein [Edaphobacter aggregans]
MCDHEPCGSAHLHPRRDTRAHFFLPVKVLSRVFRGKFVAGLRRAFRNHQLVFYGQRLPFGNERNFTAFLRTLFQQDWVVYAKPPFGGPEHALSGSLHPMDAARRILKQLGVELHPQKTRIVHVRYGFEFLGYKIKSGWRKLHLPESKIRSQARQGALYAYPKEKSIRRFMDQVRQRTTRMLPLNTTELIAELNPLLRGWGEYYKRAQVRKLFQRLDGWIRRRIWSHRYRRWRNAGWKWLPVTTLYGEYKLVRLIDLIPSLASRRR